MATIRLSGKEFPVRFDLNVMAEIQERYGEIGAFSEQLKHLKELRWIIYIIVNEGIVYENIMSNHTDPAMSEQRIGMMLGLKDIESTELIESIVGAFNDCLGDEKKMTTEELTEMGLTTLAQNPTQ